MKKPGGGETVLESRHVVGMFCGVVVLCTVFFALGWVMGSTQTDASVRAAAIAAPTKTVAVPKAAETAAPAPAPSGDWDYLKSQTKNAKDLVAEKINPSKPMPATINPATARPIDAASSPVAKTSPRPTPAAAAKPASSSKLVKSPVIPNGGMVLQVAALRSEADALALAEALQQKQFPAFVLTPEANGGFFRVQVGPYPNAKTADGAKKSLEREGFKSIVKR